jgi:hypothetical protein
VPEPSTDVELWLAYFKLLDEIERSLSDSDREELIYNETEEAEE